MPLYMDIHFVKDISVEDAKNAHIKDLAVQENMVSPTINTGSMKRQAQSIVLWRVLTWNPVQRHTERLME